MSHAHTVSRNARRIASVSALCLVALAPAFAVPGVANAGRDNDTSARSERSSNNNDNEPGYDIHFGDNGYELHWRDGGNRSPRQSEYSRGGDGSTSGWYICKRQANWC
ncbi:hypothetical protein ACFVMC_28660 [Nocardia sp. NPDC127579]|uniref:hypothetical protein n=1 Tax=Nocardia sp. NPDC127579 TaxID=3345402 RepID=UPI003637B77E